MGPNLWSGRIPVAHSDVMTLTLTAPPIAVADDSDSLLSPIEVVQLQRQIEAGLLAREARRSVGSGSDASPVELDLLIVAGEEARQRFIKANLGLVGMVSRQFSGHGGVGQADLFQEGCLGLLVAVERFDYARGNRFSTYALFWIRAYVGAASARQAGAMNLPASRAAQLRAARGMEAALAQDLGRTPSTSETAAALGRPESWIADLLAHHRPQSLETLIGVDIGDRSSLDGFEAVENGQFSIRGLLTSLDDPPRLVLEWRLGFADGTPRSFAHTARAMKVSVNKVRRMEQHALETLRGVCPQQAVALL